MTFNNLNSLLSYVEKQIQDTMTHEVADTVKDNMSEAVHKSVYDAYTPEYYSRRMNDGGLSDIHNIRMTEIENGISFRDFAPLDNGRNDYDLDDIIVNRGVWGYPHGRDFYSETIEQLEENGDCERALKAGLKNRGIEVE